MLERRRGGQSAGRAKEGRKRVCEGDVDGQCDVVWRGIRGARCKGKVRCGELLEWEKGGAGEVSREGRRRMGGGWEDLMERGTFDGNRSSNGEEDSEEEDEEM